MTSFSRRNFLKSTFIGASLFFLPNICLSKQISYSRKLSFRNLHTNETLKNVVFYEKGKYLINSLAEISYIMRDHRNNEMRYIDPNLLNYLFYLKLKLNHTEDFHIISGYRSPKTNASLRKASRGVAKNSFHIHGRAIDIAFSSDQLLNAREAAISLKRGGVGYYRKSGFIHIDTGDIRHWG